MNILMTMPYNSCTATFLTEGNINKINLMGTSMLDLRTKEQLKIHCGKRHFEALDYVELLVAKNWFNTKADI